MDSRKTWMGNELTVTVEGDEIVVKYRDREGRFLSEQNALDQIRVWLTHQVAVAAEMVSADLS